MRNRWWLGSLLLLATACGTDEPATRTAQPVPAPLYFDVKGFLDAQTEALSRQNPAVEKQVRLRGGQTETARVPHVDWNKELQIFYQADINKAALRDAYTIVPATVATDGTRRQTYRRKPGNENPVEQLTVVLAGPAVREINATLAQSNALFFSSKRLVLRADQGQLTDYRVAGVQKLVLFDTVRYTAAVHVQ